MKILFIGDIYGKVGRYSIKQELKNIIKKYNIDFCVANGENVSHGKSLEFKHYKQLMEYGVDFFTMGNHTFFGGKLLKYLDTTNNIVIPANFNYTIKNPGSRVVKVKNKNIRITSLLGQSFMNPQPDSPWAAMDKIIKDDESDIHIVDFHGETTAEKIAFATNYDGQVALQVGTHTHVQTADARILPKGTAFISDVGMSGAYHSIIGADSKAVIKKAKTNMPAKFEPASGKYQFCAIVVDFDDSSNKAKSIERIFTIEK